MKNILILALFISTSAFASELACGLTGTISERIKNCKESSGAEFQLVTRTKDGLEIYQGRRTGVIWSADLPRPMGYLANKVSSICSTNRPEFGGLVGLKWILPEAGRFIQGLKYDIQASLPQMRERNYWTSDADSFYVNSRYIFEGGNHYSPDRNGMYTFRHLEIDIGQAYVKCIVETI